MATSAPQTVVINVGAVNDPPAAVDDAVTTNEDTVLTVPLPGVLANDIDPDLVDTRVVVAVNGDPALVGVNFFSGKGGVLVNADGSFLYDPTSQNIFAAARPRSERHRHVHLHDAGRRRPDLGRHRDDHGDRGQRRPDDRPRRRRRRRHTTDHRHGLRDSVHRGRVRRSSSRTRSTRPIFDVDSPTLTTLTVTITNVLDALQESARRRSGDRRLRCHLHQELRRDHDARGRRADPHGHDPAADRQLQYAAAPGDVSEPRCRPRCHDAPDDHLRGQRRRRHQRAPRRPP